MRRSLGRFSGCLVASPAYIERRGQPAGPEDLVGHDCLRQRSPATGKLTDWPLLTSDEAGQIAIPETMSATTIGPLIYLAERGLGLAFLPPFAVSSQIEQGTLVPLMAEFVRETGEFAALWPTSRQLSPRIRVFVNFLAEHLKFDGGNASVSIGLTG
jgi:DNA-binding transcriptional LysR family regulator